jgi:membrane protease YdiL (CAAX protease family)
VTSYRLAAWTALVTGIAALNYYARFADSSSSSGGVDEIYSWSSFVGGVIVYAVWLLLVLGIAADRRDLLALRRPRSWGRSAAYACSAFAAILLTGAVVSLLPLPQSPGSEQGLAPTHWDSRYAAAFAANFVLFAAVAPVVEELMFRGVGQSLLRVFGRVPAILLVGVAFGASHGLVEGLLVLVPFGIFLAIIRDRTDSVYPGMVVHAVWNGSVLLASVLL